MLSLQQIEHDNFYIDCGDNATLRECVKLLPYTQYFIQIGRGIHRDETIIAVLGNKTYYTLYTILWEHPKFKASEIAEFAQLQPTDTANWYDDVHIMD